MFIELKRDDALVVWVGSFCGARHRAQYLEELMKHISVHSYGKCLNNRPWPEGNPSKGEIISQYRFYFSFENSIENDYVSEKVYESLEHGTVPIYLGSPNVRDYVPENSIILASDFEYAQILTPAEPSSVTDHCCWRANKLSDLLKRLRSI